MIIAKTMVNLRKALIATLWLASAASYPIGLFIISLTGESFGSDISEVVSIVGMILATFGFSYDFGLLLTRTILKESDVLRQFLAKLLIFQAPTVCYNALWIAVIYYYERSVSIRIGLWLMTVSNLIKFIKYSTYLAVHFAQNQRPTPQAPQLSQPRPNLLANLSALELSEPLPTDLPPIYQDIEQLPSYEEYLAPGNVELFNDLPPNYEDLEQPPPPTYQEYLESIII